MGTYRLKVGFPESTDVSDALAQAVTEWREACRRDGWTPIGDPSVQIITDDPERSAMGEYVVDVVGDRSDGYL